MKVICPICRKEIPPEAVNIKINQGYCAECGELFSLSGLSTPGTDDREDDSKLLRNAPPKQITLERNSFEAVLSVRPSRLPCLFLIPFTAIWGGLSLGGIYGTQIVNGKFELPQSLFGIPFLLGTLAMLTGIFSLLFTRTVFVVNETGVSMKKFRLRVPKPESTYSGMLLNRKTMSNPDTPNTFFNKFWSWSKLNGITTYIPNNHFPRSSYFDPNTTIALPFSLPANCRAYISAFLREEARKHGKILNGDF